MEKTYHVSFFKTLTDSTGHPFNPCQGTVEVHAPDESCAIAIARKKFAELKDVGVWSLRADYEEAQLLPARKRTSSSAWRKVRPENLAMQ
jgi:hypothetical protein